MVLTPCQPGEFVISFGHAHIYSRYFEETKMQMTRELRSLSSMWINLKVKDIFDLCLDVYDPRPHIAVQVTV